jgi:hypothetical protein
MAKAPSASPPPTTNGVDKLYRQLVKIYATVAAQLAECARWRCSDSTPRPVQAGTDQ